MTRVAVAEPQAPSEPREQLPAVILPSPGPSWRPSQARTPAANRLPTCVQNAILFSLAITATVYICGIVQRRRRELATLTVDSTAAAKPVATATALRHATR